jgi:hypothetical protein
MKKALLMLVVLAGCASGPPLKVPDGSRRVPVNSVVPPEAGGEEEGGEAQPHQSRKGARAARAREEGW